jgi:flagellar basal body-associated protein FliL
LLLLPLLILLLLLLLLLLPVMMMMMMMMMIPGLPPEALLHLAEASSHTAAEPATAGQKAAMLLWQ